MRRTDFIFIIIVLFLSACSSNRLIFKADRFSNFNNLTLSEAIKVEKKLKSKDITPSHLIEIGEGVYPNDNSFELATPKTYKRLDGKFELEVEYFYTSNDSSVKVILYQWDDSPNSNIDNKHKRFIRKFQILKKQLSTKLGEPTFEEINSENATSSYRDGVKWINKGKVNAYLFMFGNKTNDYKKIRLAVYEE
jgi:hypothetical protein